MGWNPSISLEAFRTIVEVVTDPAQYPGATDVCGNVPIYDARHLSGDVEDEWVRVLLEGPGVLVVRGAYPDTTCIDQATRVLRDIIVEEHLAGTRRSDHFARLGANDRVWNSLQKLCLKAPGVYARYIANPVIARACRAWLGPGYQIATQLNVVRPGGRAQQPHRDYHLGFMSDAEMLEYPQHLHRMAPSLILQGGIAHCDMPVESGTTKFLPYSQRYADGYPAILDPAFRDYFEQHQVQLPLTKGDVIFFSPALFHAAGDNTTENVVRTVNLLQVTSAFARPMEALNREAMCLAVYPYLAGLGPAEREAVIAATADGYAFPTNLDTDPPIGYLVPESQQALLTRALAETWSPQRLAGALRMQLQKRRP
ncbi:phytanoyl-CoA dioxygenase family protein [Halomonas hibernica]|uniref:phytanoyl-CoA dioxygenase family protein n=1 Tax=Halomonas hibernica TaxID=2591147 RepID=UPI001556120E|nr:phytanoyl-CoA dioxygenase family protein [Halomonas hibernica]